MAKRKTIDWIIPVYNEEEVLPKLFIRLQKIQNKLKNKYNCHFLFINDGSKDKSLDILKQQAKDSNITIINFARNFGHQSALAAGIDHSNGNATIIIDADLQDPPELAIDLIEKWEEGAKIVHATRQSRQDSWLKRCTAFIFYRLLNLLVPRRIPSDTGDFRLLDHNVVIELRKYRARGIFLRGLIGQLDFSQATVKFDRAARAAGETHYSFKQMLTLAMRAITLFSPIVKFIPFWSSYRKRLLSPSNPLYKIKETFSFR